MDCWNNLQRSGWAYPTLVLSIYGFFAMMRPGEPFLTPFLTGPHKNLTIQQVSRQVYPVWTYSNFVLLIPVFLVTDYLRYKPIIILQGLGYVVAWLFLLFGPGVEATQCALFSYGVATAAEVGYFSYIYSVVGLEHYQKVTGYCRSTALLGYTVGSVLGQLLVSLDKVSYYILNIITIFSLCIASVTSFLLPMPCRSLLFYEKHQSSTNNIEVLQDSSSVSGSVSDGFTISDARKRDGNIFLKVLWKLLTDCKECFSSAQLISFSLWWAMGTCGYYQVASYVQILWSHKEPSKNFTAYNGGVDAVATLAGAAASFAVGHVRLDWSVWGELALGLFSCLNAGSVYLMDMTGNIWVCYACYVVFKSSYMQLITICTFQIAKNLTKERYALIFGVNTFVAVALQSILTAVVINTKSLNLSIMTQYFIYGSYFAVIALIFLGRGIYTVVYMKCIKKEDSIAEGSLSERDADLPENI
ncbi:thiamine transporter 2-like isoform X1 [Amia ocellicauda]|uniref:thiamine transporter 2-like isoform X1 n=1 Tax=Amia ocellicauda TaxID=2972642 RepID=UPI0034649406